MRARTGTRASKCCSSPGARGVKVKAKAEGAVREVRAKVVVDASGQNGLLQNKLNLRVWDSIPQQGGDLDLLAGRYRDTGKDEGATLSSRPRASSGWCWYIPQHDDTVGRRRGAVRLPVQGAHQLRADLRGRSRRLPGGEGAHRRRHAHHRPLRDEGRLYRSKATAGDGWVGDAWGFLDPGLPVFSSLSMVSAATPSSRG